MVSASVSELRDHLNEYLQRVRDDGETVEITRRGEAIALMVSIQRPLSEQETLTKRFTDLDSLIAGIEAHRTDNIGAVETVREIRRDLSIEYRARTPEERAQMLKDLDQLAAEVSKYWKGDLDAVEAVREQRRDL